MAYCDRCDRYFSSERALQQHDQGSSNHNICCGIDFPTYPRLQQHWIQSPNHDYCQYCDEHFDDEDELEDHYEGQHSYCSDCKRVFKNDYGLKEHYRQSPKHFYCRPCDRHFQSEHNLRKHLDSSTHRTRDIQCRCGMLFIENSHLVLHLEAGSCSSGVDRKCINRVVRQHDRSNVFTDPSRLITNGLSGDEDITYIATRAAWNGRGFECYLCHTVFTQLKGLNQHLASPAHQAKFYICRGPNCGSRFSTLSALCQHIESDKCGVQKFKEVQAAMDSLFGKMKRLTL